MAENQPDHLPEDRFVPVLPRSREQVEQMVADLSGALYTLRTSNRDEHRARGAFLNVLDALYEAFRRNDVQGIADAERWAEKYIASLQQGAGGNHPLGPAAQKNTADAQREFLGGVKRALDARVAAQPGVSPKDHGLAATPRLSREDCEHLALDILMTVVSSHACRGIIPQLPANPDVLEQVTSAIEDYLQTADPLDVANLSRRILRELGLPAADAEKLFKAPGVDVPDK